MKLFKNQKGFSDVITMAILSGVIGAIFIGGVFVWKEVDKTNSINNFYNRLSRVVKLEKEVEEISEMKEIILEELPEVFRLDDKKDEIVLDEDYILINSILSNDNKKLAYTEMYKYAKHPSCDGDCSLRYRTKVKNLDTGDIDIVYEVELISPYNRKSSVLHRVLKFIIPSAYAGTNRAWSVHLPIMWSNDDEALIFKRITGGSLVAETIGWSWAYFHGGTMGYSYISLDLKTKEIVDLARDNAVFIDDGDNVVYLELTKAYYPTNPPAPGEIQVLGKVIFKQISDNKEIVLVNTEDIDYRIKEITKDRQLILEGRVIEKFEDGIGEYEKEFSEVLKIDLP